MGLVIYMSVIVAFSHVDAQFVGIICPRDLPWHPWVPAGLLRGGQVKLWIQPAAVNIQLCAGLWHCWLMDMKTGTLRVEDAQKFGRLLCACSRVCAVVREGGVGEREGGGLQGKPRG